MLVVHIILPNTSDIFYVGGSYNFTKYVLTYFMLVVHIILPNTSDIFYVGGSYNFTKYV